MFNFLQKYKFIDIKQLYLLFESFGEKPQNSELPVLAQNALDVKSFNSNNQPDSGRTPKCLTEPFAQNSSSRRKRSHNNAFFSLYF